MKKLISIFAAMTMLASLFVSTVSAASDGTFTASPVKASYAAGSRAVVKVNVTAPNGFAGFGIKLSYDKDAFKFSSATKTTDLDGSLVTNGDTAGVVYTTFGTTKNLMPTGIVTDPETFEDVEKTFNYQINYIFDVADAATVKNGTYDFTIESDGDFINADRKVLTADFVSTSIEVTGGLDPEPVVKDPTAEFDKDAATKYEYDTVYNYGVGGTVTVPEGKSTTGVTFDISNGTDTVKYDFDFGTSIAANTSFGLNIGNVPKDVTLTFSNLKVK